MDWNSKVSAFTAVDVIRAKRDGGVLSDGQIDWVVDAYTKGLVADEQMSALAMAILLRGMSAPEIARWTAAMIASGERLDLSPVARPTVDKHSTGGVGDKITLPLTPLVAACGGAVPMISGRGLGTACRGSGRSALRSFMPAPPPAAAAAPRCPSGKGCARPRRRT